MEYGPPNRTVGLAASLLVRVVARGNLSLPAKLLRSKFLLARDPGASEHMYDTAFPCQLGFRPTIGSDRTRHSHCELTRPELFLDGRMQGRQFSSGRYTTLAMIG